MTTAEVMGSPDRRVQVALVSARPSLLAELLEQMISRSEDRAARHFVGHGLEAAPVEPPPAVVLSEVSDDEESGAFAAACRERWPSASLLLLVTDPGPWCPRLASRVQAAGWITCHQSREELLSAIDIVARTGRLGRAASGRPTLPRTGRDSFDLHLLTGRERQVLQLLSAACSLDEIAEQLGISPNTVRTHVQNVISKLGVNSRVEAVLLARRTGTINSRQLLDLRERAKPRPHAPSRPLHAEP